MSRTVLVLGGTAEARELAAALHRAGMAVTSSLAGRVSNPRLPEGEVRIGGFGGPDALAAWLGDHDVHRVVDATHPFAERISASAARACAAAGVPLLRLERPGWSERAGDRWHRVATLDEAATAAAALGSRVMLTTGRQGLAAFAGLPDFALVRCVDPPEAPLPADHVLLLDRGPYTVAGEAALMAEHRIDVLVTKDSGGSLTAAKLTAARAEGVRVLVVHRPPLPAGVDAVATVDAAVAWYRTRVPFVR